ncbi:NYN domain-containing protein [Litoreibacter roseus]|uniref:HTH OST-type domain-containing protein n=1 Tax=Litoreibacter roseus TaxID=2601869 RepID=A0A6N6JEB9_9RHOB|nr:NYN domain-containing protein [Litoreibacter roseus]GFE64475.1 hypothetical protein KIN_15490 [Litoreibacter roseus]
MAPRTRPLYAVLIDADNIPADHARAVLKEVTSFGEPALRRVYGDWSSGRLKKWADQILDLGLLAHQETANTKGKNASDIGLVIDAMDILHTRRFDGFVLVSSDSDFTRLASRIREEGVDVIGIGERKAPESLRNVCNRFVFIENLIDEAPANQKDAKAPPKEAPEKALPLILKAMDKADDGDDWISLGKLGQTINADNPDFDTRSYGEKKLSDLVMKLKRLESRKEGSQWMVRRAD